MRLQEFIGSRKGSLSNYTGEDDVNVNYGKEGGNFYNLNQEEPIQLIFTNAHASRNFYVHLSPGLDFRPGTVAGQVDPDGTFAGEGVTAALPDPGTNMSVSVGNSDQSLYKITNHFYHYASIISMLEVTPDDATTFLASSLIVQKDTAWGPDRAKKMPLRKSADSRSFNLQFVNIYEKLIFSKEYIVKLLCPAASVTSVNIYIGAYISDTYEMEQKRAAAIRTGLTNGALKEAARNNGKMTEILSQV